MEIVNGQILISVDWLPLGLAVLLWIGMVALLVLVGLGKGA